LAGTEPVKHPYIRPW